MAHTPNEVKKRQPMTAKPFFREEIYDFSLVLGAPTFGFFRKAHLSGDHLELLLRRSVRASGLHSFSRSNRGPLVPLLLTIFPLEELIVRLVKIVF